MATSFMVSPDLRPELADELKRVTLFTTLNRAGGSISVASQASRYHRQAEHLGGQLPPRRRAAP